MDALKSDDQVRPLSPGARVGGCLNSVQFSKFSAYLDDALDQMSAGRRGDIGEQAFSFLIPCWSRQLKAMALDYLTTQKMHKNNNTLRGGNDHMVTNTDLLFSCWQDIGCNDAEVGALLPGIRCYFVDKLVRPPRDILSIDDDFSCQ